MDGLSAAVRASEAPSPVCTKIVRILRGAGLIEDKGCSQKSRPFLATDYVPAPIV